MKSRIFLILTFVYLFIVAIQHLPTLPHSTGKKIEIIGGIVPHHLFVSDIISDFFDQISLQTVDNIVVIGPNHQELGDRPIVTNSEYLLSFSPPDFIQSDKSNIVNNDQSTTSILPFVKEYFPQSRVIPIVLKHNLSLENCQLLAVTLDSLPGKTLIIASIDFSHYLSTAQAQANDKQTLALISNRSYREILKLNSDYLDSPASLVTSLIYFDRQGNTIQTILKMDNSGLRGNPYAPTTSYFSILYTIDHETNL